MSAYPQFNLKMLQLPAPASSMSKAEYREAYGIDLDDTNINAFKLVLLGNEKYPIDHIKEVEGGYEIYFNGKVLSITDTIQTIDNVYSVENAKPIYIHPITLVKSPGSGAVGYRLMFMVFNNDPTPLTLSGLQEVIENIYQEVGDTLRFSCVGYFKDSRATAPANAEGESVYLRFSKTNEKYYLDSYLNGGVVDIGPYNSLSDMFDTPSNFSDGVNKIN